MRGCLYGADTLECHVDAYGGELQEIHLRQYGIHVRDGNGADVVFSPPDPLEHNIEL